MRRTTAWALGMALLAAGIAIGGCAQVLGLDDEFVEVTGGGGSGAATTSSTGNSGGSAGLPVGSPCQSAGACESNFCVDGFCCASSCDGLCQACSGTLTGSGNGVCAAIQAGTDPNNECPGATSCSNSACLLLANGQACSAADECDSGACADDVCCDAACDGTCESCAAALTGGADGTCAPLPDGADPEDDCPGGVLCLAGACDLFAQGEPCTLAEECSTGACADGLCCDLACDGVCVACLATLTGGTDGTCAPIPVNEDPEGECGALAACDGAGVCKGNVGHACAQGADCLNNQCVDLVCCEAAACTGVCRACSGAKTGGTDGVCANVADDTDPDLECPGGHNCVGGACD